MTASPKRLAIIGCGSSGLISLKISLDILDDWEVVCFEKSDSITGCWGNPYPGFVSTSTRYTTQFACYPICNPSVRDDGGHSREEFFRDGEYGEYLESFAEAFDLQQHIRRDHCVSKLSRREDGSWEVTVNGDLQIFNSVVTCTGLAAKPKPLDTSVAQLSARDLNQPQGLESVQDKTIVVIGGGESAVDYANRLARKELNNDVYLSLHSGVRVSPRYHPVRGVPSDFLRNRLMLSVHPDVRNLLGQVFVESRIKYQRQFEWFFPSKGSKAPTSSDTDAAETRRKEWALKLTLAAKDELFNMFHNKSDDFLQAVGEQRITIIGSATDSTGREFFQFNSSERMSLATDLMVPGIGYVSTLRDMSDGDDLDIRLTDCFMGCAHVEHQGLYLVGFARPIIGNIPTISEMQARYVVGLIAGKYALPADARDRRKQNTKRHQSRYGKLNLEAVYPVEMFPYCDQLAKMMTLRIGPRSWSGWWRTMLAPATTLQYFPNHETRTFFEKAPIYMPLTLVAILLALKPVDWIYKGVRWALSRRNA